MKYICSLCKNIVEDISDPIFRCPKCGIDKSAYKIYYEIENVSKKVVITKSNPSINRIDKTCIDCGMCRKTCNSITGLNFDRNKPECVNCGNKHDIVTISSYKGGYLCKNCARGEVIVNIKTIKLLRMFYYVDINKITKLDVSDNIQHELTQFIYDYYDRYSGLYLKSREFLSNLEKI
mgnify:CR=1 FL=1